MSLERYTYHPTGEYNLECGESLSNLEIVYHSSCARDSIAEAVAQGARVVWICHALTANSDASDWWSDMVGRDKCFDTERDVVICANVLCSCYGSTSPSSWSGKPLEFPLVSVRDVVGAHMLLRSYLGVAKIDVLIGASVGGFQALEWAIMEPKVIQNLVLIACNARITAWATALNESQRMAIRADSSFGEQLSLQGGRRGLKAARSMALLSYRSYSGYSLTQSEVDEDCFSAHRAASYQEYQGEKLARRFDAYCYYYLTQMLDTHNVGRGRGGVAKVLQGVEAKSLVIGIDSDILFPPSELRQLSEQMPNSSYIEISSEFGHDGFLIEWQLLTNKIDDFLKR